MRGGWAKHWWVTESAPKARGVVFTFDGQSIFLFWFFFLLARRARGLHAPGAATRRRFFDVFSDVFLERFFVDFWDHIGAILAPKCVQNGVRNLCQNHFQKSDGI